MEIQSKIKELERRYLETKENLEQSQRITGDLQAELLKMQGAIVQLRELDKEEKMAKAKKVVAKTKAEQSVDKSILTR
jgi:hypothetical protein